MQIMQITLLDVATRDIGLGEIVGGKHHPLIQFWLSLCHGFGTDSPDEIPWCSAAMNGWTRILGLVMTRSAAARSWLPVGVEIPTLDDAKPGFDIVILMQPGKGPQPGPEVTSGAPGHVACYHHHTADLVYLVGGNQSDSVRLSAYPVTSIIGIRRLT